MLHAGSAQGFPRKVPSAMLSRQDASSQFPTNKIRIAIQAKKPCFLAELLLVFPILIASFVVNPFWSHPSSDADKRAELSSSSRNFLGRSQSQTANIKQKANFSHPELKWEQSYVQECKYFPTLFYLQCARINELLFPIWNQFPERTVPIL